MTRIICVLLMLCLGLLSAARAVHASGDVAQSLVHSSAHVDQRASVASEAITPCCGHDQEAAHESSNDANPCNDCPQCAVFHGANYAGLASEPSSPLESLQTHDVLTADGHDFGDARASLIDKPNWITTV